MPRAAGCAGAVEFPLNEGGKSLALRRHRIGEYRIVLFKLRIGGRYNSAQACAYGTAILRGKTVARSTPT